MALPIDRPCGRIAKLRKFGAWRLLIEVNDATLRCQDGDSRAVLDVELNGILLICPFTVSSLI